MSMWILAYWVMPNHWQFRQSSLRTGDRPVDQSAPYTKYLVENCPVPITYIPVGSDVYTGKSLKTTPPGNIVRTVYRDWLWNTQKKTLDDQRPSWD
ncbi:MAG: hypothetical protein ACODAD_05120 [Planctomycetota bacterium]